MSVLNCVMYSWVVHFLNYYWLKRSFGQGNIFTPVCHSVHGGVWQGDLPPAGWRTHPPSWMENPPGWKENPPSWMENPPSWMENPPPRLEGEPPWLDGEPTPTPPAGRRTPPAGRRTPPDGEPPLAGWRTPPGWKENPPGEADCGIRSTIGRYASYWNAFLFYFISISERHR